MNKRTLALLLLVTSQCLFLTLWAGYHEWVLQRGEVILLRTRPVDPRDIVRGDYMILNYDISSVFDAAGFQPGQEVFVILEKRGEFHEAVGVSESMPPVSAHQRVARGTIKSSWGGKRVEYGIEQFFVPEGKGTPSSRNITVQVVLSPQHRLNIKTVLADGKPYP